MVEDTYPEGKGAFELENTFSYGHRTRSDHGFNGLEVEHEFEVGLANNFDLKVPVAYHYTDSREENGVHFDSAAIQADFYLTNSNIDPVGIALFAEAGVGEHSLSFSQTLVLQKDFDRWVVAYNLGAETEVSGVFRRGGSNEVTGTLVNALGVAYSLTPTLRLGRKSAPNRPTPTGATTTGPPSTPAPC